MEREYEFLMGFNEKTHNFALSYSRLHACFYRIPILPRNFNSHTQDQFQFFPPHLRASNLTQFNSPVSSRSHLLNQLNRPVCISKPHQTQQRARPFHRQTENASMPRLQHGPPNRLAIGPE
jgi:hypothetical protein